MPICGMALEPRTVTAVEEDNPELRDMTRRFWVSLALTVPLLVIAMADMVRGVPTTQPAAGCQETKLSWIELFPRHAGLSSGVAGLSFSEDGLQSSTRSTNMFTLIAMGTGVAYLFSLVATFFPKYFPPHSVG